MSSRPYTARRSIDLVGRVPGAASGAADGLPAHDVPVAVWEVHATRGATDGATGGGHRASGVTPPRLPVGRARRGRRC